jgi:hypothetical protein
MEAQNSQNILAGQHAGTGCLLLTDSVSASAEAKPTGRNNTLNGQAIVAQLGFPQNSSGSLTTRDGCGKKR